jgi:hypothetical protein
MCGGKKSSYGLGAVLFYFTPFVALRNKELGGVY